MTGFVVRMCARRGIDRSSEQPEGEMSEGRGKRRDESSALLQGSDGSAAESCNKTTDSGRSRLETWDQSLIPSTARSKRYEHSTSNFQTLAHLLKGNIGTGLLALPLAVKRAGVLVGGVGLLVLGVIASHCMVLLIQSSRTLCKLKGKETLDYAQTTSEAVRHFLDHQNVFTDKKRLLFQRLSGMLVNFFLITTQFGFCCVYLVFIGMSFQQVLQEVYCVYLRKEIVISIFVPLVIVASWIRNLDELAPLSTIANICIAFSLLVIVYDEIQRFSTPRDENKAAVREPGGVVLATYQTLPLFFGGVAFAFEGIGVVLPLENKMRKPEHAVRVVVVGMTMVVLLYTVFAVLGYLSFGADIKASVTFNLISENPIEEIFFAVAKLYYAYAIFAGYLVQFYVPMDFLEQPLYSGLKIHSLEYRYPRRRSWIFPIFQIFFRLLVVLITAGIAVGLPDLEDLISLVGAFSCSALAFVIPPCLEMLTIFPQRQFHKLWPLLFIKDSIITIIGLIGFVLGTYATLVNIVSYFSHNR